MNRDMETRKSLLMKVDQTIHLMEKYPGAFLLFDSANYTMKAITLDGQIHTE